MKIKILYISFIFIANSVFAQNYIFSLDTKEPIDAVHISYNQVKGLITNEDGYFELPENVIIETLYFSHLSYKSKKILLSELKKNDTIFLNSSPIKLDEIILNNISPKDIMVKGINKINENYINTPHNLFGFLRQSLQENSKGVEMVEVEFISYFESPKISTKIKNARRTKNYSKLNFKTSGGVSAIIENGDFVRRKANFLDLNNINKYKFIYEGQIEYEELKVFKISFTPINKDNLQILRKGVLYVDSESFAFIEIRYVFDKEKLLQITNKADLSLANKEPIYKLRGVENIIKYRQLPNKKWSLAYIEVNNVREGIYKNKHFNYDLSAKLVINNTKTLNPVKVKTNYNLTKDFNRAVKRFDNLNNWKDNYKFSLSDKEELILKEINEKK